MSGNDQSYLHARFRLVRNAFRFGAEVSLQRSHVTAIFGHSGSGKTSLLRCLAGLEHPDEGKMHVNGEVWQDTSDNIFLPPHRRPVGMVFQDTRLFPHLSVRKNLTYGMLSRRRGGSPIALEQIVSLLGIESLLERRPVKLSGGEAQRVAIGRALLADPRLLLMDEPLAALDATRKAEVLPFLKSMQRELDIPFIYVSHNMEEIDQLADTLVLMEEGKTTACGSLADMLTRLDFPLSCTGQAGAIVEGRISGYDETYGLTRLDTPIGTLMLLGQYAPDDDKLKLRIHARDVSLSLEKPHRSSVLNIIEAVVMEISEVDSTYQVTIRLDAGGLPLLARVTSKSHHALGLKPGLSVYAQVKSVAITGGMGPAFVALPSGS